MKFQALRYKRVLIAPSTPLSRRLAKTLKAEGINVIGFIDSYKTGAGIYSIERAKQLDYDLIVIFNDLFFYDIYKTLRSNIKDKTIYRVLYREGDYTLLSRYALIASVYKQKLLKQKAILLKGVQHGVAYLYRRFNIKRSRILFIAKDSIGSNLLHLYLYVSKQAPEQCYMITKNSREREILHSNGLRVLPYHSLRSYVCAATAKTLVTEQVILDYFDASDTAQQTLQLWHGIALKKLFTVREINYDYFLTTAKMLQESMFANVFQAKQFLNYGYPRNDLLLRQHEARDLIFCDLSVMKTIKKNRDSRVKTVLYMPTYREAYDENMPPLDFDVLNHEMARLNICFILKLHPFALELFKTSFDAMPQYSHLIFFNTQADIYPLLQYADILVTDYSSIAFDYLLLDRPIIYFDYDLEHYIASRGAFLLEYADYTPGTKVKSQEALIEAIVSSIEGHDSFKADRARLRGELFDYCDAHASERVYKVLKQSEELG